MQHESRKSKLAKAVIDRCLVDYSAENRLVLAQTPSKSANFKHQAAYDAVVMEFHSMGLRVSGIVEAKARWFTDEVLEEQWGGEWLLSKKKIDRCRHIAKETCVPFFGLLASVPMECYWFFEIADASGKITVPIHYDQTETQQNTEGDGLKSELNAFIKINPYEKILLEND